MSSGFKKTIRYLGVLLFTVLLLWITLGSIKLELISEVWESSSKPLLLLSTLIAITSHYFRAERWKLLLNPIGYSLKSSHSFMSVMVGYFVNLAIPRGGELSRCYNLYKLNKTPVNISFGTVISERIIDLIFLLVLIGTVSLIQLDTLSAFFASLDIDHKGAEGGNSILPYVLLIGVFVICALALFFFYRKRRIRSLRILIKAKPFMLGIKSGILSISKLEKRGLFVVYSLLIWVCYFFMNYFVMQAFPATSDLTLSAALTIFVIGGIALAIPLPGGAGSYHLLVSAGLTFIYGVAHDHALAFSVIVHGWQTLIVIILGAGSLILSQIYYKTQQK